MTTRAARTSLASLILVAGLGIAASLPSGCNRHAHNQDAGTPSADTATPDATDATRHEIDLFAFGRQLGTIAPCGCTTEPLGGLQYAFGYIEAHSSAGQRLILEPGSFLFPDPDGAEAPTDEAAWAQAQQRAELLQRRFSQLDGLVSGLGPTDFASSSSAGALASLPLPRVIANIEAGVAVATVERQRRIQLGHGLSAAVTLVVDPQLGEAAGATAWGKDFPALTDPVAALRELAPELSQASLQVVMVHGPRSLAEAIAREVEGLDVVVMGGVIENPERGRLGTAPVQIGDTWLLEPGDRAQTISHLTLSIDSALEPGKLPEQWTLVPAKSQREAELARVEEKLAKFAADPAADPAFIGRLEADRDRLRAELERPGIPSDVAVALIPEQVKVTCHLAADEAAKQALGEYDAWVADRNRERFAGVRPPAPPAGQASYVGIDACADCHEEAVAMWKTTVHARGYQTLVTANKQFDLSCVGCHVTGFRQPGGSEVVENHHLQSVQCEQCHGPGSLHVEDPSTANIRLEAPSSVCLSCHTPEHSDTFEYEAYLRDILGPGHGADARAKLGEGPTGRQLRAAGLEKAGGGCKKM
ncbi:MAG TPA: multiheme c-type cytochrome [Enhygromyxa sp.]|nr:multiheme c-type cytochrome [Enhygromyxa sp.]